METNITEIADGIYRLSTLVPEAAPGGFSFNQFLIDDDEPMLFHCGMRSLFPLVSAAAKRVLPLERLRWISFGHVEADECGSVNDWLAAAPNAQVVHGVLGCAVSVNDLVDRPPLALEEGAVIPLGRRRMRMLRTPHVPHGWESIVWFEEVTRTLLCGDVLTTTGDGPALVRGDLVAPSVAAERAFGAWSMAPGTSAVLRGLADLEPTTLGAMHGSSFAGDGAHLLRELSVSFETIARERRPDVRPDAPSSGKLSEEAP